MALSRCCRRRSSFIAIRQLEGQILAEEPVREFALGAIGKVWHADIPFVHINDAQQFAAFSDTGFVKVAWAIRTLPWGEHDCRVEFEVRIDATDDDSWRKFKRYFKVIGPASHFIRRTALASVARTLGTPEAKENDRPLAGAQIGADRGGFYSQHAPGRHGTLRSLSDM